MDQVTTTLTPAASDSKMKKSGKDLYRGNLTGKSVKNRPVLLGSKTLIWVETKNYGLKISVILARWTY